MKYRYKVKEEGTDKEETMEAMSLHKLIKKLDPKNQFGFVYIITNTKNKKAYVGCKQYYSMGKKKTKHK